MTTLDTSITFETDPDLPDEVNQALQVIVLIRALVDCLKRAGRTKEQAVKGVAEAVALAWDEDSAP